VTKKKPDKRNLTSSVQLILGGARSGKSAYAERLASDSCVDSCVSVVYVATAQAFDDEMRARIQQHQADRPSHWQSIEVGCELPQALLAHSTHENVLLVDCLTLWLMSVMHEGKDIHQSVSDLVAALSQTKGRVLLVSNEITMGVVPMGKESRLYVDELGRLHQRIAALSSDVTLMVAGIPMVVKSS
jgi:adenosylcobinamide kinase/adenosylcobinamide-phosphate guanylyltransferase